MVHLMTAPTPDTTGVGVGTETYYADESGTFAVPDEAAVILASRGWVTVGFADDDTPKRRARKTTTTTEEQDK